jgi:hypothetical protein
VPSALSNEGFLDNDGNYMLSSDAEKAAFCTRRVLRAFGIGEPFPWEQAGVAGTGP